MTWSRRRFLAGLGGAATLAACASSRATPTTEPDTPTSTTSTTSAPATTSVTTTTTTTAATTATTPSTTTTSTATTSTSPATTATTTRVSPGAATFVDHGPRDRPAVALTFHLSGDVGLVTDLLDLLAARLVPITAFAVGTWITAHPDLTRRVVADGHELGNHTEHHLDMAALSPARLLAEISECGQAMVPFIGSIGRWFRPSSTVVPTRAILDAAGAAGYRWSVGYDVDSTDNHDPGAAVVVDRVRTGVQPGSIVSLHFGHRGTVQALPQVLDVLATAGLTPVTLSGLLGGTG